MAAKDSNKKSRPDVGNQFETSAQGHTEVEPQEMGYRDLFAAQDSIQFAIFPGDSAKNSVDELLAYNQKSGPGNEAEFIVRLREVGEQLISGYPVSAELRSIESLTPLEILGAGHTPRTLSAFMLEHDLDWKSEVSLVAVDPKRHRLINRGYGPMPVVEAANPHYRPLLN